MSRLKARLDRLEAVLIPATPEILTITCIKSETGEVFREFHLELYPANKRSRQTGYSGEPAQTAPLDRR